jgi:hypothetical protein
VRPYSPAEPSRDVRSLLLQHRRPNNLSEKISSVSAGNQKIIMNSTVQSKCRDPGLGAKAWSHPCRLPGGRFSNARNVVDPLSKQVHSSSGLGIFFQLQPKVWVLGLRICVFPSFAGVLDRGSVQHILNIALIGPRHGLGSCLSGCLIFNRLTDCSRIGLTAVEEPLGGILVFTRDERGAAADRTPRTTEPDGLVVELGRPNRAVGSFFGSRGMRRI